MEFQKYFQSYADYFWHLNVVSNRSSGQEFIYEITDGGTIAYSDYVIEVVTHLSEQSLPPFGALLLAITASNQESLGALVKIKEMLRKKEIKRAFPNANLNSVDAAFTFLNKIVSLPNEYKTGSKRLLLFQTIFKNCHNRIASDKAKELVDYFINNKYDYFLKNTKAPFSESNFIKDIKAIALLNSQFPLTQSIIKAMEALPETEEIEQNLNDEITQQEVSSDKQKDFVEELIDNNKTFHVGSLLKRLWSGLKIPLHHNLPSNQPLGGIADITNKGDFDKLLISEFANEDLVFMSRIANNEALYIEREIPPQDDEFTRDILIDSSIKNWGNPKVVAFATALAIAKHPKTEIECNVMVLGAECQEIAINTVHEVIDGLNLLSGKIDCASGLSEYFEIQNKEKTEKETFLILSEDSYKSEALQKVVHENFEHLHFLLTTTVEGEINFYKIANKGKKLIQKIKLPLEELWTKKKKGTPIESKMVLYDAPILFPLERNYKNIFHYNSIFYAFSNGILYQFSNQELNKGFIKIASGIPFSKGNYALYENEMGEKILVNYFSYYQTFSTYNVDTKEVAAIENAFVKTDILSLFPIENRLYLTNATNTNYWVMNSGKLNAVVDSFVTEGYRKYSSALSQFVRFYSANRFTYDLHRKLEYVFVDLTTQNLEFNDYTLVGNDFKKDIYSAYNDFYRIDSYANLIFKRTADGSKLLTIKALKDVLKISLQEATEILDQHLPVILKDVSLDYAEKVKVDIEKCGAVCYIEIQKFQTEDGSAIRISDGILELESSNKNIPKIYIPLIINRLTSMATNEEFAGNEYFLPENSSLKVIPIAEFHHKYIKPFITIIIENGISIKAE